MCSMVSPQVRLTATTTKVAGSASYSGRPAGHVGARRCDKCYKQEEIVAVLRQAEILYGHVRACGWRV